MFCGAYISLLPGYIDTLLNLHQLLIFAILHRRWGNMSVASASIQFFTRLLRYRTKCGVPFHAASRILISPYLPQVFGGNKVLLGTCAQPLRSEEKVTVYFINRDGRKITTSSAKGDSLLDLVVEQNLDIEGFGACEGTLACSTCHVILDQKVYNQLGPITDEENDMLDLAFGLTDTTPMNMLSLAHSLTC
uniref:adrenodoxin, mitochondrial-like isoform X3 n=1 Tax=Oncorhynchus gorbuscha TaxID=8017 RepID=UPI001EAF2215|nr:adrenodoxin, mitochondrial-like isoform X3 [Oncorhynchus gorbuscha]